MLLTRALPADIDLLALQRLAPRAIRCCWNPVAHGTAQGRWDLLLAADGESLRLDADGVTRDADGQRGRRRFPRRARCATGRRSASPRDEPRWPFRGGWALLLGYEARRAGRTGAAAAARATGALPVALALRCPAAVLRDHASGECVLVAEAGHDGAARRRARRHRRRRAAAGAAAPGARRRARGRRAASASLDGVRRVLDYLARRRRVPGQPVARLARALRSAAAIRRRCSQRLRRTIPAPFAGVFAGDDWAVVSSSPERLVSVRGDVVETRPIAGTRPRFAGDDDAARIRELVGHPKERAEHVMLIDLERNDLGRVCAPGSVEVDELMTVESYAHVHHIVSNVRGRLRAGRDAGRGDPRGVSRAAPSPAARRCAACRSSPSSKARAAAPTPARWAGSTATATWTSTS